ncbi:hypothetical protein NC651_008907 [Populus alba x Populus x berolinensis]|nr:hypothetical protein NC651_008907 [Populus alba x Populus x berolinensis]
MVLLGGSTSVVAVLDMCQSQLNLARVHGGQERLPTNGHPLINPSCLPSWPDLSSTVQHSRQPPSLRSPPLESQSLPCFAVENHSCENGYGTLLSIMKVYLYIKNGGFGLERD